MVPFYMDAHIETLALVSFFEGFFALLMTFIEFSDSFNVFSPLSRIF